jgi:riboflavin kinase/FMN adenylyltransferase
MIENKYFTATIGNFDGVHIGHQDLIRNLQNFAKEKNQSTLLITFDKNSKLTHSQNKKNFLLTTHSEKLQILKNKVDKIICISFTNEFKEISAESFIENTLKKLQINSLVIGKNFRFGKDRLGDIEMLKKYFDEKNIRSLNLLEKNNIQCSSTMIRNLLHNGEIEKANNLLGYDYFIQGRVRKGKKIASNILGFPTINIINEEKILPKFGVYKVIVSIKNKNQIEKHFGIANIGIKPTISNKNQPMIEVHIKDFSKNIYRKNVKIEFIKFIREEKKFDNIESLKEQIQKDINMVFSS